VHPDDDQHVFFFPSSSISNLLCLSFAFPPIPCCNLLLNNDDTTEEKNEVEKEETGDSVVGKFVIGKRDPPAPKNDSCHLFTSPCFLSITFHAPPTLQSRKTTINPKKPLLLKPSPTNRIVIGSTQKL
jgi:hypothetical protein